MKRIPLTQGKVALIDDEDYELINDYPNCWYTRQCNHTAYAMANPRINGKKTTVLMHRFIMKAEKGKEVDHINHNGLDNRRCNLRIVNRTQQQWNRQKYNTNSPSIFKRVYWHKSRKTWRVDIKTDKRLFLGYFKNEIDAAKAYDRAAIKYFDEYACLNFPRNESC